MRPKVIFLPHANIQYSQLKMERREWVVKNCYEKLFDLVRENQYKIGFEASGKTLDDLHSAILRAFDSGRSGGAGGIPVYTSDDGKCAA